MADEPLNLDRLREATLNDEEFMDELIDVFLDDSPNQLDALRQAVESSQVGQAAEVAHRLKGASGNMGADSLCALCRQLEEYGCRQEPAPMQPLVEQADQEFARVKEFLTNYRRGREQGRERHTVRFDEGVDS